MFYIFRILSNKIKSIRHMYRLATVLVLTFLFCTLLLKSCRRHDTGDNRPVVIWWHNNFADKKPSSCPYKCEFTHDRRLKDDPRTEAFLFYGSEFDIFDLPLPRRGADKIWALLHEESPRNTPILCHDAALGLFNYSSTVSRHSDVPLTLQYLNDINELLDDKYFISTERKNDLLKTLSPILYIQSDCETSSYRDYYVKELMKYIPVDSYGICLNNRELPNDLVVDYLNKLNDERFLNFVGEYKFTIAMENGICEDYITEKLWRPLKVGSVPIYMGSPSIRDWLPNEKSAIVVKDFESMQRLAAYLKHLNGHDDEYEDYLRHKTAKEVGNLRLREALNNRTYNFVSDEKNRLFVDAFECFVCEKIYERRVKRSHGSIVSEKQYECVKPNPPTKSLESWWLEEWNDSLIRAKVLKKFLIDESKDYINEDDFNSEVGKMKK